MIAVRPEEPRDAPGIRKVHEGAFGRREEADLVDALRSRGKATLSMVAARRGKVVAHALLSPVRIVSAAGSSPILGLGPVAVLPRFQCQGIGSRLVRETLRFCSNTGHPGVVALGHPEFLGRFGFVEAEEFDIDCELEVPEGTFLVRELTPNALRGRPGIACYQPEFEATS